MNGLSPENQADPPESGNGNGAGGAASSYRVRFATFEVDLRSGELRKGGLKIRLQDKPFQILALLLEQPGQVVTREEIQRRVWPSDTFVDFDRNMNTAANRLRQALGDSADNPRFIETIPRRGYRLVVPVEFLPDAAPAPAAPRPTPDTRRPTPLPSSASWPSTLLIAGFAIVVTLAISLWWATRPAKTAPGGRTMLVVLPFENLSGNAEQDYLSDGMTDEMITQLSRLNPARLGVIARTSSMRYKGARQPVNEIARELGVDYALEGSVRVAGNRLRITSQLVNVREQATLWSETYERDLSDILSVQREVAGRIAGALTLELLPAQRRALAKPLTANPEAYDAYLLGRYNWGKRTRESLQKALADFRAAIAKDPQFAAPYSGLADTYVALAGAFLIPPSEAYPQARAAVQKALELDPDLAEAHASQAAIAALYDWDWGAAERSFRRAIELNPGSATAHQAYGEFLSAMGRHAEALAEIEEANRLDPFSLTIGTSRGIIFYQARRSDDALAACRRTLEMDATFAPARVCVAMVYVQRKLEREGVEQRYRAMITEGFAREEADAFWRAFATGGINSARRWLIDYRIRKAKTQYVPAYLNAVLYASQGEHDQAFAWLEKGFQQRDAFMIKLKVDPNLDPLRSDPRFGALLRRMNLTN